MIRWFRRSRPDPAPHTVLTQADIVTAHAWGLTLSQWWGLTDFERAECRRNVATAPKFKEAS
jgi:hypothetical protein